MTARSGEKLGWMAGWLGGFLWVDILALIFLLQQKWVPGAVGLILTAIATAVVLALAPWRHPATRYWRLMIAPYVLFFASAVWAIWAFGGLHTAGLNWWNLALVLPILMPFGSIGRSRWCDGETPPSATLPAGAPIDDVPCRG